MEKLTAHSLAAILHEPHVSLLREALALLGQRRCHDVLQETLRLEANGGLLTHDGQRRRTPGGVFFFLAFKAATPYKRRRLRQTSALIRQRSCVGKVRYPSKAAASEALAHWQATTNVEGAMHAYMCERCATWHIGRTRYRIVHLATPYKPKSPLAEEEG